jgi:putative nucleotidyltransferase with HDIG domain
MKRPGVLRLAVFVATTVAAWGILAFGGSTEDPDALQPGDVAARDYYVVREGRVLNQVAYEQAQEAARASVDPVLVSRPETEDAVLDRIDAFFADIDAAVRGELAQTPATTVPGLEPPDTTTTTVSTETTTTTTVSQEETEEQGEEATTDTTVPPTTIPQGEVLVEGFVFIDADGDGVYDEELPEDAGPNEIADVPLPGVGVTLQSSGRSNVVETRSDGTFGAPAIEGEIRVTLTIDERDFPQFEISAGELTQTIECFEDCAIDFVGLQPKMASVEDVVAALGPDTVVSDEAIATLAAIAREDVVRTAAGGPSHLAVVQQAAITHAQTLFGQRVLETSDAGIGISLEEARNRALEQPPLVYYTDTNFRDEAAGRAAGDIVANFILPNWEIDEEATEAAAEAAANSVPREEYEVLFREGEIIAAQDTRLTQLQIDAIRQTGGLFDPLQRGGGLLAVLTLLSGVLALYLNRFRPEFWARPRMVALLGILIVMAAAAVRGTTLLAESSSWYILPAVAFGLMTSVLFDSRIGVLMALSMAILAAVGTRDPGVAVYSLMATMAPIPFVSSVSTRRAFRNAAVFSATAAAVMAAGTSWFFHVGPEDDTILSVGTAAGWAFGVSLVAALVGLALLQFFESAFDITTTLALLDLTDRNHEALQLLQEKAFGTFNHSLMVGTLADAAARAIGADPLLARASAYYHDLGKTENPTMFIENQFGIANPHDEMSPEESAEVIRRHVTDGLRLAKKYKIPSEVSEAIVSHHGDGIMRYFYEKAREADPGVDPDLFRHVGHKPRTAVTAIVMLADALEASCRAVFQHEEPTPDAIEKVVNRVIDEKINDGQLSESPLTLAQITQMRKAFLSSLVGHYHQRIVYPNFPGS